MENVIFELARSDHRYAGEAYEFACETVTYTQARLGKLDDDADPANRHVCGEELLRCGCELAVREFGLMAPHVFERWGVQTTDDFGELIFRLIEAGRLARSDSDDPSDFHDVFDLKESLAAPYQVTTEAYEPRTAPR